MFDEKQKEALSAKLDRAHVKPPPQGKYGDYVEGWFVISEANRIFGFDGWTRETTVTLLGQPRQAGDKWRVDYMGKVRVTAGGVVREGCGFGQGIDRDIGMAHESAIKEAETDSTKRALMTFGNPFGLALYDKTQENVQNAPPSPREARTEPSGVKRLTSSRAKEIGLDAKLKGLVAGCADEPALDMLVERFDTVTAEAPLSWLDSIWNMIELRREELRAESAHRELDDEYRAVMS